LELAKLQGIARVSRLIGALIVDISKIILTLIIVFFFAMALGFYLGELMGSNALGFLTTGGIFLLILLLVSAFEPKVEAKFMDIAVRKFYNKWHENDAEQSDMTGQEANLDTEVEDTTEQEEHEHKNQ
jgi:hypothetical protein